MNKALHFGRYVLTTPAGERLPGPLSIVFPSLEMAETAAAKVLDSNMMRDVAIAEVPCVGGN